MDHSTSAPTTEPLPTHGVLVETRGPVAYVRFDRPPVNAFSAEMLVRFRDVLSEFAADKRPVLLAGTRGIFSAGFDIKQSAAEVARADELSRDVLAHLRQYPAPIVAAVEGAAVGLGLLIATSADLLVVSRSAVLRMPEVTLGIDTDTVSLERFLPPAWIRRLCLTGVGYTPEDMHLAAAGVSVCDAGSAFAVAKTLMRQFDDIDSGFLARAKQRLALPDNTTPGSSEL
jgi:enoyl-CoA hydratase/carnithine racemase